MFGSYFLVDHGHWPECPLVPTVITISSHVAYGAVGNRIAVPVLEGLGVKAVAVSTVNLPWHPGMNAVFGKGSRCVPDDEAFGSTINDLIQAPWLGNVDGVMSGYLGRPEQALAIAKLIGALKQANPRALYLCDPVIGDQGGLYVPQETAVALRDHLWPLADIVTPNLFEFGWMTGEATVNIQGIIKAAKALGRHHVLITSAPSGPNEVGNLLITGNFAEMVRHKTMPNAPNGTGDMLAALFFGWIIKGDMANSAIKKAVSSVLASIEAAKRNQSKSLAPEHFHQNMATKTNRVLVDQLI